MVSSRGDSFLLYNLQEKKEKEKEKEKKEKEKEKEKKEKEKFHLVFFICCFSLAASYRIHYPKNYFRKNSFGGLQIIFGEVTI